MERVPSNFLKDLEAQNPQGIKVSHTGQSVRLSWIAEMQKTYLIKAKFSIKPAACHFETKCLHMLTLNMTCSVTHNRNIMQ